jgi:hypothetical protein
VIGTAETTAAAGTVDVGIDDAELATLTRTMVDAAQRIAGAIRSAPAQPSTPARPRLLRR